MIQGQSRCDNQGIERADRGPLAAGRGSQARPAKRARSFPGQVARIADSIAAFGFNVPVLVDEKGEVLAGHGRPLAARRLGLKEFPRSRSTISTRPSVAPS